MKYRYHNMILIWNSYPIRIMDMYVCSLLPHRRFYASDKF